MDIGTLKNYSDLAHDLSQTKKNALEKMAAVGGVFNAYKLPKESKADYIF